ncbi:MAG: hypothetical protein E7270_11640 [Lachnospiraceae bacterium]|nr:hypothetical protein [Lachnospiraceae bacterium]
MKKIQPITQEEWEKCNEFNRNIVDEFLNNSFHLSPQSKKAYKSNLMIWFNWVRKNLNNKPQYEIKPLEYLRYQSWLLSIGHSSSDISNKRAAISSLCNYMEMYYIDQFPNFRTCIAKGMSKPEAKFVREKIPPTKEEMEKLFTELEMREEWQKLAYLKYTYDTGCRRAESIQLLKEVVDYMPIVKEKEIEDEDGNKHTVVIKYYRSNSTRCKGRGETGKIRKLVFTQDTMDAINKWLEVRGDDDCPYVFVSGIGKNVKQISDSALNKWASGIFTEILGRRFHPHILREARATTAVVEEGKSIESVQKLLGHQDSSTTVNHYIIRDETDEEIDELFID